MKRLTLDLNDTAALASALDNYLNGIGMDDTDEDEDTLQGILDELNGA